MRSVSVLSLVIVSAAGCSFATRDGDDLHEVIDSDSPHELAIELWNSEMAGHELFGRRMLDVTADCEAVVYGAQFETVNADRIGEPENCADPIVNGCFRGWWKAKDGVSAGADIVLRNSSAGLSLQTRTHELVHAIAACMTNGRPDHEHEARVWQAVKEVRPW